MTDILKTKYVEKWIGKFNIYKFKPTGNRHQRNCVFVTNMLQIVIEYQSLSLNFLQKIRPKVLIKKNKFI